MTTETDRRAVVERVLTRELGPTRELAWASPAGEGPLRVRVAGRGSRATELVVSSARLELDLTRPARTVELEGDYTDTDLLERDLAGLARLADRYLRGQGRLRREQGLLGVRRSLVVTTRDGEWRIGPRGTTAPGLA